MNKVTLEGTIKSIKPSHEHYGERFNRFIFVIKRLSGTEDEIPVIVSERIYKPTDLDIGSHAIVFGEYRSYNENNHLILYVFASIIQLDDGNGDINIIELKGYLGRPTKSRETPLGRKITDVLIAVNRVCGRTDYIPCIAWGRNAEYCKNIETGSFLIIKGRIQSRFYTKDDQLLKAYEVSIAQINMLEEAVKSS